MGAVTLVPALFGLGAGTSLVVLATSLRTTEAPPPPWPRIIVDARRFTRAGALVAAATAGAYLVTGWLAGAALAGLCALVMGRASALERRRAAALETTRAVASWAKMLRSTLAAAAGIEEAILATAPRAPAPIRAETMRLAARLRGLEPMEPALTDFAAALCDPTADQVALSLIVATTRQARDLGGILDDVADAARADAAMRQAVEANRARQRTAMLMVGVMTVLLGAYLLLTARPYLEPYDRPFGQLMLVVWGGTAAGSLLAYQRMAHIGAPGRLLLGPADTEAAR